MKSDLRNERLRNIFGKVGSEFGYGDVYASFIGCKDFKIRWQRTTDWIDFKVSDYLEDAPENVLEGLGRMLFERISGKGAGYCEELIDWFNTVDVAGKYRETYLARSRNLAMTPEGESKDLQKSFDRLVASGLVKKDLGAYLTWSKNEGASKIGQCSVLMKVVTISKELDKEYVPEHVLDWCLYKELCHIMIGFDPTGDLHEQQYDEIVNRFDEIDSAESWLEERDLIA